MLLYSLYINWETWKERLRFSIFNCMTFGTEETLNQVSIFSKNEKMLKEEDNF